MMQCKGVETAETLCDHNIWGELDRRGYVDGGISTAEPGDWGEALAPIPNLERFSMRVERSGCDQHDQRNEPGGFPVASSVRRNDSRGDSRPEALDWLSSASGTS
jgi:hypothetical protein